MVDEYLPIMNRVSAMVDGIEDELLGEDEDAPEEVLDSLFHLKHELSALGRLAVPQRETRGQRAEATHHPSHPRRERAREMYYYYYLRR